MTGWTVRVSSKPSCEVQSCLKRLLGRGAESFSWAHKAHASPHVFCFLARAARRAPYVQSVLQGHKRGVQRKLYTARKKKKERRTFLCGRPCVSGRGTFDSGGEVEVVCSVAEDLNSAVRKVDLQVETDQPSEDRFLSVRKTPTTDLEPVLPPVPLHRRRKVLDALVDAAVPTKLDVVAREDDLVLAGPVGPDAVVGERVGRVEVEDPEQVAALKHDHLVRLHGPSSSETRQFPKVSFEPPRRRKGHTPLTSFLSEIYACGLLSHWYLSSVVFIARSNAYRYLYRSKWSSIRLNWRRAYWYDSPLPMRGKSSHSGWPNSLRGHGTMVRSAHRGGNERSEDDRDQRRAATHLPSKLR